MVSKCYKSLIISLRLVGFQSKLTTALFICGWKWHNFPVFIFQHLKDKFWNFIFYKFIFIFGVLNVQTVDEVIMWCLWFSALVFLHLMVQLCKDRFEYVSTSNSSYSTTIGCWTSVFLLPQAFLEVFVLHHVLHLFKQSLLWLDHFHSYCWMKWGTPGSYSILHHLMHPPCATLWTYRRAGYACSVVFITEFHFHAINLP